MSSDNILKNLNGKKRIHKKEKTYLVDKVLIEEVLIDKVMVDEVMVDEVMVDEVMVDEVTSYM